MNVHIRHRETVLYDQKIRNTTKVITFQSSAANIKQLYVTKAYVTNEA